MDLDSGKIICKAKSLTTREDLSIGIRGSIAGFDADLLKQVGVVSMSSTLATNSVVEGKGLTRSMLWGTIFWIKDWCRWISPASGCISSRST